MRQQMTSGDEADHEAASRAARSRASDRVASGESNPNDLIGTLTSPGRRAACDVQTRRCMGCAIANKNRFPPQAQLLFEAEDRSFDPLLL
jgi:hypothetical protein